MLPEHFQPELAEAYYNSVFCHLFHRSFYNNSFIFVWPAVSTEHLESEVPSFRSFYPARDGFGQVICEILESFGFRLPFRDRRTDVRNLMRAIRARFPRGKDRDENFQLAVLSQAFYRNKGAHIIGKAINGADQIPFVIPVLNDERRRALRGHPTGRIGRDLGRLQLLPRLFHGGHRGAGRGGGVSASLDAPQG